MYPLQSITVSGIWQNAEEITDGSLPVQCQHSASKQCTAISSECTCSEIKVFQGFSLHHWRLAKFIESYYQCNFFFDNCDDITMMMMMSIAIAVDNVEGMIGEGHSSRRRLCQCAMTVFVTQDMEYKRCNTGDVTQDMEHTTWYIIAILSNTCKCCQL